MIPRYARPAMAAIWSDQAKYERWLQVEVAAVQAWAAEGAVPLEEAEAIAEQAGFALAEIDRYQAETHHEMTAFLRSVTERLGPEGRWVHLGADGLRCLGHGDGAPAARRGGAAGGGVGAAA